VVTTVPIPIFGTTDKILPVRLVSSLVVSFSSLYSAFLFSFLVVFLIRFFRLVAFSLRLAMICSCSGVNSNVFVVVCFMLFSFVVLVVDFVVFVVFMLFLLVVDFVLLF